MSCLFTSVNGRVFKRNDKVKALKYIAKIHSELSSRTHGVTVIGVGSLSFYRDNHLEVDSIKDVVQSSVSVLEFDKHLKKAGGHWPKHCENNNKR